MKRAEQAKKIGWTHYETCEMCRFFCVSRSGYYGYVYRMYAPAKDLTLAKNVGIPTDTAECKYGLKETEFTAITLVTTQIGRARKWQ